MGGDPAHNAEVVRRVVGGERGAHRDIVVLNAAAALVVAGVCATLVEGVGTAEVVIDEGRASSTLDRFIDCSQAAATA